MPPLYTSIENMLHTRSYPTTSDIAIEMVMLSYLLPEKTELIHTLLYDRCGSPIAIERTFCHAYMANLPVVKFRRILQCIREGSGLRYATLGYLSFLRDGRKSFLEADTLTYWSTRTDWTDFDSSKLILLSLLKDKLPLEKKVEIIKSLSTQRDNDTIHDLFLMSLLDHKNDLFSYVLKEPSMKLSPLLRAFIYLVRNKPLTEKLYHSWCMDTIDPFTSDVNQGRSNFLCMSLIQGYFCLFKTIIPDMFKYMLTFYCKQKYPAHAQFLLRVVMQSEEAGLVGPTVFGLSPKNANVRSDLQALLKKRKVLERYAKQLNQQEKNDNLRTH